MLTMVAVTLYDGPGPSEQNGDQGDASRKVSCGFAHPIIRATTIIFSRRTLPRKYFRYESLSIAQNGPDRIYGSARARAGAADHKQYIIDMIYRAATALIFAVTRVYFADDRR